MKGYFVTGTDTGVGKTVAAAWLALHMGADYWKPVQSGLEEEDTAAAQGLLGPGVRCHAPAYRLTQPLSPHEAARRDGVSIDMAQFVLPLAERLVVEGAGGALVPLNEYTLMVDLMRQLGLPVVVVARTTLGTINHTLLTLEALRARGLEVAGVILNGPPNAPNSAAIEIYGRVRVLAELPRFERLDKTALQAILPLSPL